MLGACDAALGSSINAPEELWRQQWAVQETFVRAVMENKALMKAARQQLKALLQDARLAHLFCKTSLGLLAPPSLTFQCMDGSDPHL